MDITTVNDVSIVRIPERFDGANAPSVETTLTMLIRDGARRVVCDFSPCGYISSGGLRVLLSTNKVLKKEGGLLVCCALRREVREVFEIAGFTKIFAIAQSCDDALAQCSQTNSQQE